MHNAATKRSATSAFWRWPAICGLSLIWLLVAVPSIAFAWLAHFAGYGSDKGLDAASRLGERIKRLAVS